MKTYKHVIVVGIDGAGAFIKDADTPCFDRIFARGAVTYGALASNPTISAECWGSMLIGVGPEVHKLRNEIVSRGPYPVDAEFPTVFRRIRAAMPDAVLGSFCEWNPITSGIVEGDLNVCHETGPDAELTGRICEFIKTRKPLFLFCQIDSVDGAGHRYGYGSAEHLSQIHKVDGMIDAIYTAAVDAGSIDETLFMVIADHGGTPFNGSGASHGGWTDAEKYVTFAAAGSGVKAGNIADMNVRDLAAIVLYALGIEPPEFSEIGWTSQIPAGLFEDGNIPEYRDISRLTGAEPRRSRLQHTSEAL
ncbi:MAG: alkaline phosphatase [Clostridia bacterium]|nr:alkaline phosphatase [Clostridia bacterium]